MKAKDERKELENMIDQASHAIDGNVPRPGDTPELQNEPAFDADLDELQKDCNKRARKLIKNSTGFVLTDEQVKQNPYLKNKMDVDIISLAGMLYQMECTKLMQRTLMEEVRHGAQHPRMYEVFSGLSKTIADINKQLLQTVEAIKVTYIDLKDNINRKKEELHALGEGNLSRNEKGLVSHGTKDLIKQTKQRKAEKIKNKNNNNDIEDVEEIK